MYIYIYMCVCVSVPLHLIAAIAQVISTREAEKPRLSARASPPPMHGSPPAMVHHQGEKRRTVEDMFKPFKTIENHLKNTKNRKEFNLSGVTQLPLCVRPKRCLTTSTSLHTATRWFSITRWYLQRCNCRAVGSIFRCRTSISQLRVITIR